MGIEVVCPSYGRTGTKSMHDALEILGFGPCYHIDGDILKALSLVMPLSTLRFFTRCTVYSVFKDETGIHPKLWLDGYQGRGLSVKKILEGYKAVTDWPCVDFFREILQEYPEAKVVITLRDPDAWWASIIESIHQKAPQSRDWGHFFSRAFIPRQRLIGYMVRHIPTLGMEEEDAKADFIRHVEEIKAFVPAEKRLEFSVKQGWEPLCKFLGVPVPDVPFPRTNSRAEFNQVVVGRASKLGWMIMAAVVGISAAGACVVSYVAGTRAGGMVVAVEASLIGFCLARHKAMIMKTYYKKNV